MLHCRDGPQTHSAHVQLPLQSLPVRESKRNSKLRSFDFVIYEATVTTRRNYGSRHSPGSQVERESL